MLKRWGRQLEKGIVVSGPFLLVALFFMAGYVTFILGLVAWGWALIVYVHKE